MRQLGTGVHVFENTHKILPANGGPVAGSGFLTGKDEIRAPSTRDFSLGMTFRWGLREPNAVPTSQPGSWAYSILAQLKVESLPTPGQYVAECASYRCPSRDRGGPAQIPRPDAYGVYFSNGLA